MMLLDTSCSSGMPSVEPFLQDGSQTVLHVESLGHALHAFINGKLAGTGNYKMLQESEFSEVFFFLCFWSRYTFPFSG